MPTEPQQGSLSAASRARRIGSFRHDQVRVRPPREMIGFFVNQGWKREEPEDGAGELAMVKALLDME